jgi:hypothetical protein
VEALLVAIGGLIGAIAVATKVLTEVRGMRIEQDLQAKRLADVHNQTVNDHKSNFRSDLDDVRDLLLAQDAKLDRLDNGQTRLEAGQLRHDKELSRMNDSHLVLTKTVSEGLDQLRDADAEDRRRADQEHDRLRYEIANSRKESADA